MLFLICSQFGPYILVEAKLIIVIYLVSTYNSFNPYYF